MAKTVRMAKVLVPRLGTARQHRKYNKSKQKDYKFRDQENAAAQALDAMQAVQETLHFLRSRTLDMHPDAKKVAASHLADRLSTVEWAGTGVMDKKPMIIGIAPARGREDDGAWTGGQATERLCKLLDLTVEELPDFFDLENVWATEDDHGAWKGGYVMEAVEKLVGRPFVLALGAHTIRALFGFGGTVGLVALRSTPYESGEDSVPVIYVPHTSGRCFYWNSPENVQRAIEYFHGLRNAMGLS
jgi:hypothetical protein